MTQAEHDFGTENGMLSANFWRAEIKIGDWSAS